MTAAQTVDERARNPAKMALTSASAAHETSPVTAFLDLYWLPVGAGTSRFQQASLRCWEAIEAARARRPRQRLLHGALKLGRDDSVPHTLELMPAFVRDDVPPLVTGPVGIRGADRLRLFRYQLLLVPAERLPDEDFAVCPPIRLSDDPGVIDRLFGLAATVPPYTWGRRVPGTTEMWTSDSVVSWLLMRAAIDASALLPAEGRAPGWLAGIELAR